MLSRMALQTLPRHLVLRMRQLVQDMEDTEDGATWLDANDEFHGLLYRQANRPWIVEIVDRARRLTARYTRVLIVDMNRRSQIGRVEHSDILDAIELRDSKLLETRLVDHMRSGHDIIVQHLAANPQLLTDQSHISGSDGGGRRIVR
jgi:DNA-binding GntR family transcriptional regulator